MAFRLGSGLGARRGFKIQLSHQEISLSQHSFGLDVSKKTLCLSFLIWKIKRTLIPMLRVA